MNLGILDWAGLAVSALFIFFGIFVFGWFRILKETNTLLKEQNEELKQQNQNLKNDNKEWLDKHIENQKAISELKGKIESLTIIPLASIDDSLKQLAIHNKASAENTSKTFEILKKSALIAEKDKEMLFSQNITEQHVEHQTIEQKIINKEKK